MMGGAGTGGSTFVQSGSTSSLTTASVFRPGNESMTLPSYSISGGVANFNSGIQGGGLIVQTGGTVTVTGGQVKFGSWGDGTWKISGGTFTMSGGNNWFGNGTVGTSTLQIIGHTAAVSITTGAASDNFVLSRDLGSHGQLIYQLDSAGVGMITDAGGMTINAGSLLNVDVTAYAELGIIDLVSYGSLNRDGGGTPTFDTVTIQSYDAVAPQVNLLPWGSAVTSPLQMTAGHYYLDYGNAGDKDITLFFNVPEPATLALLVLGGAAMLRRRRG